VRCAPHDGAEPHLLERLHARGQQQLAAELAREVDLPLEEQRLDAPIGERKARLAPAGPPPTTMTRAMNPLPRRAKE
jgi:hypothetical protein